MAAYYSASLGNFVHANVSTIAASLHSRYATDGFSSQYTAQTKSWEHSIPLLQKELQTLLASQPDSSNWQVLLEYPLYRLRRRIDVVILASFAVVVVELKVGETSFRSADRRQVEEYALDLRDFHAASSNARLMPVLWCTRAPVKYLPPDQICLGIAPVIEIGTDGITGLMSLCSRDSQSSGYRLEEWESSPYRPVPNVIDAATTLFSGHGIREIAKADATNLDKSAKKIVEIIERSKSTGTRALIFLAGVPGSGKTLAGLQIVHSAVQTGVEDQGDIVYLSGNTPLVVVLREALARDMAQRRQALGQRAQLAEARNSVRTRIQHIIDFLREYLTNDDGSAPHEHVIVFDEAQRAWDEEYGRKKFNRPSSEPKLLLEIMARHPRWSAIVALVGGGQEINSGENGIAEWGKALRSLEKDVLAQWNVYGPPGFQLGSEATAQLGVGNISGSAQIHTEPDLELSVPLRSFRSPSVSQWVSFVLAGQSTEARALATDLGAYPLVVTRSVKQMHQWLKSNVRGERRFGLVASSGSQRLRADGYGVTLNATDGASIAQWYLNARGDVRSSFALEVPANEYTTQGLELDFVGLCWGGDLVWNAEGWRHRQFRGNSWAAVNGDRQRFITNSYRVLMTRGREGLAIWIPEGSLEDPTRSPVEFDLTAQHLIYCGAKLVADEDR